MKDKNNKEPNEYITSVNNCIVQNNLSVDLDLDNTFLQIVIDDGIKTLRVQYKGKEYEFDLVKTLSILCKEVKNG